MRSEKWREERRENLTALAMAAAGVGWRTSAAINATAGKWSEHSFAVRLDAFDGGHVCPCPAPQFYRTQTLILAARAGGQCTCRGLLSCVHAPFATMYGALALPDRFLVWANGSCAHVFVQDDATAGCTLRPGGTLQVGVVIGHVAAGWGQRRPGEALGTLSGFSVRRLGSTRVL